MTPEGLAAVELARQNGNWDRAYDGSSTIEIPEDFAKELQTHPSANTFFKTLSKSNRYAFLFKIVTAKKENTRKRRIKLAIELLEKGEKL